MQIVAAVGLIAILVFIHEFGHFIVAKAVGVSVPVFSLGFGRKIFGFTFRGTEYRLSAIPFGGYVRLAGADPFTYGESEEEECSPEDSFLARPVWQRLAVIAAGPAFNLVLPFIVFTMLFMGGDPQSQSTVGVVAHDSVAARAGIHPGDVIVQVGDAKVRTWNEMSQALQVLEPGTHPIAVERRGSPVVLQAEFQTESERLGIGFNRPGLEVGVDDPSSPAGRAGVQTGERLVAVDGQPLEDWIGLNAAFEGISSTVAITVEDEDGAERSLSLAPNPDWAGSVAVHGAEAAGRWGLLPASLFVDNVGETVEDAKVPIFGGCTPSAPAPVAPAHAGGIQRGDRLSSINGATVHSWDDVLTAVAGTMEGDGDAATARPLAIEVVRAGQTVAFTLTPEVIRDTDRSGNYYHRPILGVTRDGDYVAGPDIRIYYGFADAVHLSGVQTTAVMKLILGQLGKVVTGEAAVDKSFGGPVEMFRQASKAAEAGFFPYARLLALLSLSLGIVNLLPVPVLDGGQLLFFTIEAIRGRPLSAALRERAQQVGVLFLVMLMLMVLVFDVNRLFEG